MTDDLDSILQRVASGQLSPAEAEPLIAAATAPSGPPETSNSRPDSGSSESSGWPEPPPPPPAPPEAPSPAEAEAERRIRGKWGLGDAPQPGDRAQRIVRLQVLEGGKSVVNLRIPVTWAGLAGSVLPGISGQHADRIREAIRSGTVGRILEVQDEDGDGVIISTE
jgi:hypothetical protein